MFIFNDKFYKGENGKYYTGEYLDHNGSFDGKTWTIGSQTMEMEPAEDIRYEYGSGKIITCNYSQYFRDNDAMILANTMVEEVCRSPKYVLDLYCGNDYDEENDNYFEIFQYFIIDEGLAEALQKHTDEIVYYIDDLDLYILGVAHWGTSWDYVGAEYKL